jgi:hypothetical protein
MKRIVFWTIMTLLGLYTVGGFMVIIFALVHADPRPVCS